MTRDPQGSGRGPPAAGRPGQALQRFDRHGGREIAEACLILVDGHHEILREILQNPRLEAYVEVIQIASHGSRPGIVRRLLSLLVDPHPPSGVLGVISHRDDLPFVRQLLQRVGNLDHDEIRINIKRLKNIAWLEPSRHVLAAFDEVVQPDDQKAAPELHELARLAESDSLQAPPFPEPGPRTPMRRFADWRPCSARAVAAAIWAWT